VGPINTNNVIPFGASMTTVFNNGFDVDLSQSRLTFIGTGGSIPFYVHALWSLRARTASGNNNITFKVSKNGIIQSGLQVFMQTGSRYYPNDFNVISLQQNDYITWTANCGITGFTYSPATAQGLSQTAGYAFQYYIQEIMATNRG
jgi:hypothetical protein